MKSESNNRETMDSTSKKTIKKKAVTKKNIKITKFDDLEGKFLHIKVGNSSAPATTEQISDIQNKIVGLFEKNNINCLAFVTHHAVIMDIIEKESKK